MTENTSQESLRTIFSRVGVSFASREQLAASLPFSLNDVTAGSESELQAVVCGNKNDVDLPQTIEQSNFFANMIKRAAAGEAPRRAVADLEHFLADNPSRVWENSWVRFPRRKLSRFAGEVLEKDLQADKTNPSSGPRADAGRFQFRDASCEEMLRVPVSYLIKLALADVIGSQQILPEILRQTAIRLLGHYLNDNTSPETFSFNVVSLTPATGMGRSIARETALRFLMTQLLVMYANQAFGIADYGQKAMVYFAPHPPLRQKELNDYVSDSFYRDLFMSPCLSGWDKGEDKFRYMQLCHQVLSRSQFNAIAKLRDSGIISTNLVVLPNLSNISLANNGTHISIGSRRLTAALADKGSGFTTHHEKRFGDLAIKISEHFLPLFVGTYSAAPYRLAFNDFHPERALGFLPHELDYTHLRMIWRRWKKKADLSIFGQPLTPFGPQLLDRLFSTLFRLKGDFVPDFRLVDYLVCLLSTERSPGLDGQIGNSERLRRDLADMGVFDEQMSVYLLYKQREFSKMGFSGFEGRYYSQFGNFLDDMGRAADLQTLITAQAYKYMALGTHHGHIPDGPSLESERRQIFFGTAIGIPTFFVRRNSTNAFLSKILKKTEGIRSSHRYPGYLRVQVGEYRKALVMVLREDAADLIELMNLHETINDLEMRINDPDRHSAAARLTDGILSEVNARSPLNVNAREFNAAAEQYYRTTLRRQHMDEAINILDHDCRTLDRESGALDQQQRMALRVVLQGDDASRIVESARQDVLNDQADISTLLRLMNLVLLTVYHDSVADFPLPDSNRSTKSDSTPVYRAG
ncbi:MAG: hypothetical protein WCP10_14210 [Desulfuromonadales bacterium]